MTVYFACSSGQLLANGATYKLIVKTIIDLGHTIPENWVMKVESGEVIKDEEIKKDELYQEGIEAVKMADLLVAEISIQSVGVGYQIATAMQAKIPVLCLLSEEFGLGEPSQIIQASNSPLITIRHYKKANIRTVLEKYFREFRKKSLMKFNFIITPEIENYLNWKSRNGKLSKSEILRSLIKEKIIIPDKEYYERKGSEI